MDGNQRWSKINNLSLQEGYSKGLENIKHLINSCAEFDIKYLTLYALSSENIKRSSISIIFEILSNQYNKFLEEFKFKKNIKIKIIGEKMNLPKKINNILTDLENKTKNNKGLNLNIAFNYGTDKELLSIINNIINNYQNNKIKINNNMIKKQMYLSNAPDPDILIRTGGYQRLSNFLLLKLSYTELFFTKTLWPDFDRDELIDIFEKYSKIERKYGL